MMKKEDMDPRALLSLRSDRASLGASEEEWRTALTGANPDPAVGIRHAALSGDEHYRLHVASIPQRVGCHYHRIGDEQYSVVQGQGVMHFGLVNEQQYGAMGDTTTKGVVRRWYQLAVKVGDTFTIPQQYAHQLCSVGSEELVIVFACPDSHLDERDRTLLGDAPGVNG
jgi:mannose-6-phosphate isomerase-like protein (cupin superfamily)